MFDRAATQLKQLRLLDLGQKICVTIDQHIPIPRVYVQTCRATPLRDVRSLPSERYLLVLSIPNVLAPLVAQVAVVRPHGHWSTMLVVHMESLIINSGIPLLRKCFLWLRSGSGANRTFFTSVIRRHGLLWGFFHSWGAPMHWKRCGFQMFHRWRLLNHIEGGSCLREDWSLADFDVHPCLHGSSTKLFVKIQKICLSHEAFIQVDRRWLCELMPSVSCAVCVVCWRHDGLPIGWKLSLVRHVLKLLERVFVSREVLQSLFVQNHWGFLGFKLGFLLLLEWNNIYHYFGFQFILLLLHKVDKGWLVNECDLVVTHIDFELFARLGFWIDRCHSTAELTLWSLRGESLSDGATSRCDHCLRESCPTVLLLVRGLGSHLNLEDLFDV